MELRKKRVVFHSNFCKKNTGFAKAKRNLMLYLYKTGKYDIIEFANGYPIDAKFSTPWETVGTFTNDPRNLANIKGNPSMEQMAGYGHFTIDQLIEKYKPDVYVGIEDIWAFKGFEDKRWWYDLSPVVWTTLDSLPILDEAYDIAESTPNFYVWAKFAETEMKSKNKNLGHIDTIHGPIDHAAFYRESNEKREELRKRFGLTDEFIIGFVFRNQLRKSVPNLLDGFLEFKKRFPEKKPKLLLHTSWEEGWDILKLMKERHMDMSDVLTTYYCRSCGNYEITSFQGRVTSCKYCGQPTMATTNIQNGVDENQLREIYNLMDVYCHPFTSGGQEIPIQEAKMCELITLVTNYSCGEEYCTEESGGLPLSWTEYREPGSQFIKATTLPSSIAYQLGKVAKMDKAKREEVGKRARAFVENDFSIETIGKKFEEIIDKLPFVHFVDTKPEKRNVEFVPDQQLDNQSWALSVFHNVLKRRYSPNHRNVQQVVLDLNQGAPREQVLAKLKEIANQENLMMVKPPDFGSLLDDDDAGRRVAVILPGNEVDVFLSTSILKSIKERYPDHNLYYVTNERYFDILSMNPYVHRCVPFFDQLTNSAILEGAGKNDGYFDIAYILNTNTQIVGNYTHNGKDIIHLDLNNASN